MLMARRRVGVAKARNRVVGLAASAVGLLALALVFHPPQFPWQPVFHFQIQAPAFSQLGQGATVDLAGTRVGQFDGVTMSHGMPLLNVQIDGNDARLLHADASATIEPHGVLGTQFIELDGGSTGRLAAGAVIPASRVHVAVTLDQVLNMFQPTDYVLQSVNRLVEEEGTPAERLRHMARAILPATGTAAVATAAGVTAFAVSGVPLVRQFGLFLALGVVMSWLASVVVGLPLLSVLVRRARPRPRRVPSWDWLARPVRIPALFLLPVILAGLTGWAALSLTRVQTNPTLLLPPGSAATADANAVARQVGYAGELDLVVTGPDVTRPDAVAWMGTVEQQLNGKSLHAVNGLPDFLLGFSTTRCCSTSWLSPWCWRSSWLPSAGPGRPCWQSCPRRWRRDG